jgi:1-acyl-sn-glycerol-3-phosphate acyltransferase
VSIVLKESLLRYPVFGTILRAIDPIVVRREKPREDLKVVLKEGQAALGAGRFVLVFPQHTRSLVFDPASFNSIGVKLAQRSDVPVVPLALKTDFLGIGKLVKDIGRLDRSKTVQFRIGPPMHVEKDTRKVHAETVSFIAAQLREWGGLVRDQQSEADGAEPEP